MASCRYYVWVGGSARGREVGGNAGRAAGGGLCLLPLTPSG